MADTPINLNIARKAKARSQQKLRADENAVKFGQRKDHRILNARSADKAKRRLDQLKLDKE